MSSCPVNKCYAAGSVSATSTGEGVTVYAGFIGRRSSGEAIDLFYDYEVMNLGNPKDTGNTADYSTIYAKTTLEMKTVETFGTWDLDTIWIIDAENNGGYPTLRAYVPTEETDEEEEAE